MFSAFHWFPAKVTILCLHQVRILTNPSEVNGTLVHFGPKNENEE